LTLMKTVTLMKIDNFVVIWSFSWGSMQYSHENSWFHDCVWSTLKKISFHGEIYITLMKKIIFMSVFLTLMKNYSLTKSPFSGSATICSTDP
jgi:hypothetical protein